MANVDNAHGLKAVRNLNGGRIPMNMYWKKGSTTAVFEGDVVVLQSVNNEVHSLTTTTGSDDIIGVAANYVAAKPLAADGTVASAKDDARRVWVYDNPHTVFLCQSDGGTDADHHDYVGSVATMVAGAGSTSTGLSAFEVDASAITSTGTATNNIFRIIGVGKEVTNDVSLAHAELEVLLIRHMNTYRSASV